MPQKKPQQEEGAWARMVRLFHIPERHDDPVKWAKAMADRQRADDLRLNQAERTDPLVAMLAPYIQARTGVSTGELRREAMHTFMMDADIDLESHLYGAIYGKAYGDALNRALRQNQTQFRKEHPIAALSAGVAGTYAQAELGGSLLRGGAAALGRVAPAAERALAGASGFAARHPFMRTVGTNAAAGAAQGAGEAGPDHRGTGAATGAAFGAGAGALFHTVGAGIRDVGDRVAVKLGVKTAEDVAAARLARAARTSPGEVRPALYAKKAHDVASPSVLRVMRRAAEKATGGEGISPQEADRLGVRVPITERVERLTPGNSSSVAEHADALQAARGLRARVEYRTPYAHPVALSPEMTEMMNSTPFRKWVTQAENTQLFRDDPELMHEFDRHRKDFAALRQYALDVDAREEAMAAAQKGGGWDLSSIPPSWRKSIQDYILQHQMGNIGKGALNKILKASGAHRIEIPPEPQAPVVSAGTLDLVRSRLLRDARALGRSSVPDPARLSVLNGMANVIDKQLTEAGVPGLDVARGHYRAATQRIDALAAAPHASGAKSQLGHDILTMDNRDFRKMMADLPPEARQDAQIALRDEFLRLADDPTKAGPLLREFLSTNSYRNMQDVLGRDAADQFIGEARRALEAGGVKTSMTNEDQSALHVISHEFGNPLSWTRRGLKWATQIAQGAPTLLMTKEEAEALLKFSQNGEAHVVLQAMENDPGGALARTFRSSIAREMASWETPGTQPDDTLSDLKPISLDAAPPAASVGPLPPTPALSPVQVPQIGASAPPVASQGPTGGAAGFTPASDAPIPRFTPLGSPGAPDGTSGQGQPPAPAPVPYFAPLGVPGAPGAPQAAGQ